MYSTATTFFLSDVPHEPSVLSLNQSDRQKRIDLVKKGIDIATYLKVPVVSFQSGYVREEHLLHPEIDPKELLISAVKELVSYIGDSNVTLVIEPEPGMFIESIEDGLKLIKEINSNHFKLHMDIGHVFCTENNYIEAIKVNLKDVAYMHLADIKTGDSIKFEIKSSISEIDFSNLDTKNHSYLYSDKKDFVFYSNNGIWVFVDNIEEFNFSNIESNRAFQDAKIVEYNKLSLLRDDESNYSEIKAYIDSISGIDLYLLDKLKPIFKFLRNGETPIIARTICNTIKGKVHYHERLGQGEIDLKSVLRIIKSSNYNGFVTVELYNHVNMWDLTLPESYAFIQKCITDYSDFELSIIKEWGYEVMGDAVDHRLVLPPYIRLISYKKLTDTNYLFSYDLRFVQPGKEEISSIIMHSLEHLLMKEFKRYLGDKYIFLAPMGCQTGFYLVVSDICMKKDIGQVFLNVLNAILKETVVPYQTKIQCGNYTNHDLEGAKELVSEILKNYSKIFDII